ncbi:GPW/gp25 family protein [Teredinibacter haidensis]|uniref:GPW/gp25 family protein n=1 Tax=Teredinibacter haidensis TaxID=2731755 RepID=UPI000948DA40|nr:GPW/gp25 family protein [Teredinibacter haidensis]
MANSGTEYLDEILGLDLWLDYRSTPGYWENADLRGERGPEASAQIDLRVARGVDTLRQAITNRLKTHKGELAPLGHPEYGSRHHELIGEPNVERTRNLIKLYILQALKREPRIEKVLKAEVSAQHNPPRDVVRIELSVKVVREALPLDIIVPFNLEEST